MNDLFDDLESLRISIPILKPGPQESLPRHEKNEMFLKGPIPLNWINRAMGISFGAWAVGTAIWREAGRRKKKAFVFNLTRLPEYYPALNRRLVQRVLPQLEKAGLISVRRESNRTHKITILKAVHINVEK